MGLDQYAYVKGDGEDREPQFYWRKHAKLQLWAETLFEEKTNKTARELNCGELILDVNDITDLEGLLKSGDMPESPGGFFYGHQFQDEQAADYASQDLEFCAWAKAAIEAGNTVVYSCWW